MRFLFSIMMTLVMLLTSASHAATITYTHYLEGVSGSLAGIAFGPTNITVTATADTANVQTVSPTVLSIPHFAADIDIDGVGDFSFLAPTRSFINDGLDIVGFARGPGQGTDLIFAPSSPLYNGWDLTSALGPVFGGSNLLQWSNGGGVLTDGGLVQLVFGANFASSFEASLQTTSGDVPIPGASVFMATFVFGARLFRTRYNMITG